MKGPFEVEAGLVFSQPRKEADLTMFGFVRGEFDEIVLVKDHQLRDCNTLMKNESLVSEMFSF